MAVRAMVPVVCFMIVSRIFVLVGGIHASALL
jgi:hypothetical protein